jgi:uncharacterized protein YkwD
MSLRFLFLIGLAAFPGLSPVLAQQTSAPAPASHSVTTDLHNLERQAFDLINAYRKTCKLPLLQWNSTIAQVARDHSRDMAAGTTGFGHAGFHERVASLGAVLAGLKAAGENVFECDDPDGVAQCAVDIWIKSPPHLHNIIGDYNYSGLGVWQAKDGMIYFTQIFVKLKPADVTAQAPPPGIVTPLGLLAAPGTR